MDDAEFERQKRRISDLADRWIKPLGLNLGRVRLIFERDSGVFEESHAKFTGVVPPAGLKPAAFCLTDWRYIDSSIHFNLYETFGLDDEELEETFVHELQHIFLNEMREEGIDHEERVATTLARAFIELRDSIAEGQPQRVEEHAAPDQPLTGEQTCSIL